MAEHYVYAYIDPRNMRPFYVGKGKGLRKFAHLADDSSGDKTKKIEDIRNDGEEPIIRVLANGCTEEQALLIESTLIWWHQDILTNKIAGHKRILFRPNPQFSLLKQFSGFDFANGIYLVNCGDGGTRKWEDFKRHGFLCAGWKEAYSKPLKRLNEGDLVVAYLRGDGYIGIGKVTSTAVKARDFVTPGGLALKAIADLKSPELFHNEADDKNAEYCIGVEWICANDRGSGKFRSNHGLYTTPLIVTSLLNQPKTIKFIESEFDVKFEDHLYQASDEESLSSEVGVDLEPVAKE